MIQRNEYGDRAELSDQALERQWAMPAQDRPARTPRPMAGRTQRRPEVLPGITVAGFTLVLLLGFVIGMLIAYGLIG